MAPSPSPSTTTCLQLHSLPVEVRVIIRDYFLALQVIGLIDTLWNSLRWESRHVNCWNILMNEKYKLTTKVILHKWLPKGEIVVKSKILAYCEKRLHFADKHTPANFVGFDRPRPSTVRKNLSNLFAALFDKSACNWKT
jgi:hypothetical protein